MLLEKKVALITGASRGIGEAIALKFAQEGANIAFTYATNDKKAKILEYKLTTLGIKAKAYKSNAGDFSACELVISEILKEFGNINILVNNAGISKDNLLLRITPEQWDEVMNINLKSVFNITKQVLRPMMKTGGSIINMSSIVGQKGNAGQASYAASKAGIIGFTKTVALELGSRNIRCNAIAPGFIETDMTQYLKDNPKASEEYNKKIPLGRFGRTEDIAEATLFLASDKSAYITGQVLSVCGGLNI
ncbi:MAG: 3-oxoacyl-[acyl-carrier-protein] reductase [Chitinophagaceae bacterium]